MNKVKFKVYIKIISLLVLLLAFLMLPFGQFEPTTAEGEYQISKEEDLRNWLNNVDNVQTNNPNAVLTQSMTINWGEYGVANYPATIESGSTLDGQGFTVYLPGGTFTTKGDTKYGQIGLFAEFVIGTLKNTNFELLSDYNITIHADTAQKNELLYVGVICGKLDEGTIENCSLKIDHNIYFSTNHKGITNSTDASSNHFGAVAGGMWGSALVSNVSVVQTANSTITTTASQGFAYLRTALICADPYTKNSVTPTIRNVYVERNGQISFGNNSSIAGGEIYGAVVGDLDTGDNGADHNINIDGVIYNSTYNQVYGGINFNNRRQRSDNIHGYIIGAKKKNGSNFTISNIYSLVEMTDTDYVTSATIGYTQLPSEYSYRFNGDNLVVTNSDSQGKFIWSVSNNTGNDYNELYKQLSNAVEIPKKTVDTSTLRDNLNITLGQIIESAIVGFESAQVVYSGVAFQNVRIRIGDEIIEDDDFEVSYADNLNAYATSGKNATFSLQYPDREDGIFISSKNYFIEKEGLSYDNQQMTINQAQLSFSYTPGDIYTNQLVIEGLVNNEMVTIDDVKYGNGSVSFDCLNNSQVKSITFEDGIISTNYNISQSGLSDLSFTVTPKTISVSEGVTILNADDESAVFAEGLLTIYSKTYQSIELSFAQNAGYLNRVDLTSSEGHLFNISSSLSDNVMSNTISSDTANELHYLDSIVLNESLQKVAVKIDIDTSLISNLTINGQRPVKYGDYLLIDADFGEELEFVITLLDDYQDYPISYSIASEPSQVEGNSFKINAISQANNIMLITISITAPSV